MTGVLLGGLYYLGAGLGAAAVSAIRSPVFALVEELAAELAVATVVTGIGAIVVARRRRDLACEHEVPEGVHDGAFGVWIAAVRQDRASWLALLEFPQTTPSPAASPTFAEELPEGARLQVCHKSDKVALLSFTIASWMLPIPTLVRRRLLLFGRPLPYRFGGHRVGTVRWLGAFGRAREAEHSFALPDGRRVTAPALYLCTRPLRQPALVRVEVPFLAELGRRVHLFT